MIQDNLNIIIFIVTVFGFYFAYFQWFKINREKKIHLLKLLKVQLDCLGPWVGSTGGGYGDNLTKSQKIDNANPFKVIYTTGSSPLIDSTLLEQMSEVPERIIGEINQLHYDFKRIESIQSYRNLLTSSDIKLSTSVRKKSEACDWNTTTFENFFTSLPPKEKDFVAILVSYGKALHCDVIGNVNHGARQHWEEIQKWIRGEIASYKKPQHPFIVLTFVIFSLVLFVVNSFWKFSNDIFSIALLSLLLTALVSISARAIIINNERS
ncbi:MAG TPA: hypothetical protein VMW29_02820 [Candidatus Bathyarchaeia archaeon]|nr:hypothetical protein [Candidatus Bathyarchaeia archaeon]